MPDGISIMIRLARRNAISRIAEATQTNLDAGAFLTHDAPMAPVPLALAMVISDAIWTDPGTGKKTILGTFSAILAKGFPLQYKNLAVYLALTDARGTVPLTLRLVDVDELRDPVANHAMPVEFVDPIAIVEGVLQLSDLVFPEPGEYRLQLLAETELIIERRIVVMPAKDHLDE
jgi:hypothetical protein